MSTLSALQLPWRFLEADYIIGAATAPARGLSRDGTAVNLTPYGDHKILIECFGPSRGIGERTTFEQLRESAFGGAPFRAVATSAGRIHRAVSGATSGDRAFAIMDLDFRGNRVKIASRWACVVEAPATGELTCLSTSRSRKLSRVSRRMNAGDMIFVYSREFNEACKVRDLIPMITPALLTEPHRLQRVLSRAHAGSVSPLRSGSLFVLARDGPAAHGCDRCYPNPACQCFSSEPAVRGRFCIHVARRGVNR